jgi:cyclophilin family peptidyl-prolyl cis-trans isomerase
MCKLNIKHFIYSQLLVYSLFLFSACSPDNKFANTEMQEVYIVQDERNAPVLIQFLEHENEDVRKQAAIGLGFCLDEKVIPALKEALKNDKNEDVRAAAAFSLGQQKDSLLGNFLIEAFDSEKENDVKSEIAIALGKCNQPKWFLNQFTKIEKKLYGAFSEGLFQLIYLSGWKDAYLPMCMKLIINENCTYFTSAALSRALVIPNIHYQEFLKLYEENSNIDIRINLSKCLVKSCINFKDISRIYSKEENYIIRLNIVKSALQLPEKRADEIVELALKDNNLHIQEVIAEWSISHPENFEQEELTKLSNACKHERAKYFYAKTILLKLKDKEAEVFSNKLIQEYTIQKDEYIKGYILNALSGYWKNLEFIEQSSFDSESILIREFGYEALLSIRKDKRFLVFADVWNKQVSKGITLENYFARIIKDAIETEDVSLLALSAEILRDSTILSVNKSKIKINYANDSFLESAMNKLLMPRDAEIYGELFKTIQFRKGKIVEGRLVPEFNNPINWELVERIPQNQTIEIRTSKGNIILELWTNEAPGTVGRFVKLITDGFYNSKRLHRVVPGFVIQDGCPRGDGFGSTMETIRTEIGNKAFNKAGIIGMASAGTDTESCQWFITHCATPHLNGRYTAFGEVTEGMDVVHKLMHADEIFSIKITDN